MGLKAVAVILHGTFHLIIEFHCHFRIHDGIGRSRGVFDVEKRQLVRASQVFQRPHGS